MKNFSRIFSIIIWIVAILSGQLLANMASPPMENKANSIVASKNMHILDETIHLNLEKYNERHGYVGAEYRVIYNVFSEVVGLQIPFLFHALEYQNIKDYPPNIYVDGKRQDLFYVGEQFSQTELLKLLNNYSNYAKSIKNNNQTLDSFISIAWNSDQQYVGYNYSYWIYSLKELFFFKCDLEKGKHQIIVEYFARPCENYDYSKTQLYRYSLQPARYWKSFGSLTFELEAPKLFNSKSISTNLGTPHLQYNNGIKTWKFSKIPTDFIYINVQLKFWEQFYYSRFFAILLWLFTIFSWLLIQYLIVKQISMGRINNQENGIIRYFKYLLLKLVPIFLISIFFTLKVPFIRTFLYPIWGLIIFIGVLCSLIIVDWLFSRYLKRKNYFITENDENK